MAHRFNQAISDAYNYATINTQAADYTILNTDPEELFVYTGDDSGGDDIAVFTLPAVGTVSVGRRYTIVNASTNPDAGGEGHDFLEIQDSGGSTLFVLGKLPTSPEDRFNSITLVNTGSTWLSTSDYNFPKLFRNDDTTDPLPIDADNPTDIFVYTGNIGGTSTFAYTLPTNASVHVGRKYTFINKSANGTSGYDRVRINNNGGTEVVTISNSRAGAGDPYGTVTVVNDGTDWLTSAGLSIV